MGSTVPAGVKLLSLPSAEGLGDLPATIFSYATITGAIGRLKATTLAETDPNAS